MAEWNKNVKLLRLLNENHDMKTAAVEGEVEDKDGVKQSAVLLFEKSPFEFENLTKLMNEDEKQVKVDFVNDVYHKLTIAAQQSCNVKFAFICPATAAHIKKYSKKSLVLINETAEIYKTIVKPFIEKNQLDAQWVYNIIDGKSERDRILLENEQFIVLPDIMWDGKAIDSIHLLGLVKNHDIHSIRDLRPEHIPLLESILEKTTEFITTKYNIEANRLRAFFHYPPTFYHLHVHFTTLNNTHCGCEIERGHLVQDVIDHLKMYGDYYEKKTFYYKLAIDNPLYDLLMKKN